MKSEPHFIVEKTFTWNEFVSIIFESDLVGVLYATFAYSNIKLQKGILSFLNGPLKFIQFLEEDNQNIIYGLGKFSLTHRQYDEEQIGEDADGYPIYKKLASFSTENILVTTFSIKTY